MKRIPHNLITSLQKPLPAPPQVYPTTNLKAKMQTKQELSLPLIRTLPHEIEREVNESVTGERIEEPKQQVSRCGEIVSLLLSALLFLQFNLAIVQNETDLGFTMVNCSIALFTVTYFLFQKTLDDAKIRSTIALLLVPEIVALGASAFVYFQYPTLGFLFLILGMLLMSLIVVWACLCLLRATGRPSTTPSKPTTEVDILVV